MPRFRFSAAQPLVLQVQRQVDRAAQVIGEDPDGTRQLVLIAVQASRQPHHDRRQLVRLRPKRGDFRPERHCDH